MFYQLTDPGQPQVIIPPQDSVSRKYGALDGYEFCGEREVIITGLDPYQTVLNFDPVTNTITVESDNINDVKTNDFSVLVRLQKYPEVKFETSFTVVTECHVKELNYDQLPKQVFQIGTPEISFTPSAFTQVPACDYPIDVALQLFNPLTETYETLPDWITHDAVSGFTVFTEDKSLLGQYQISVKGTALSEYPEFQSEHLIPLVVADECAKDIVSTIDQIPDEMHNIARDDRRIFNPTWAQELEQCAVTYQINRVVDGIERPLT